MGLFWFKVLGQLRRHDLVMLYLILMDQFLGALEPSHLMSSRGKLLKQPSNYVPQHINGTKCGFFVLCYIYLFIKSAPHSFSLNEYPYYRYSEINMENKKKHKYFHYVGTKSFANIIEKKSDIWLPYHYKKKLKDHKMSQPSSSSPTIATVDDAYAYVFGKDRGERIRGVGIGPTQKSLWGVGSSQSQKSEKNMQLAKVMKELVDKLKNLESYVMYGKRVQL
ncbi:hypothetical protein Taro_046755 [Colocasia esculenta]|uniref:Ubiquitin-like protease family profile domain-containing protein n=1 Tax=Colocasia esculenta TaxID=4460 RepID=A0A843X4J5_COLES|nr:hypothetical protein [Colocasia esculenta]